MSHRLDRSLGVKPFNNTPVKAAASQPKAWSLKLVTVLKVLLVTALVTGAVTVLINTNDCSKEVRCAD